MRIQNLRIENFRGFIRFEMKKLGRINLLVGENNSGKTTVLEAISILMADGNPSNIWAALDRRREFTWVEVGKSANVTAKFYEVRELFHGYDIELGACFRLSAESDAGQVKMLAEVKDSYSPRTHEGKVPYTGFPEEFDPPWNISLSWENPGSHE